MLQQLLLISNGLYFRLQFAFFKWEKFISSKKLAHNPAVIDSIL